VNYKTFRPGGVTQGGERSEVRLTLA
jgi:hypothetical protein